MAASSHGVFTAIAPKMLIPPSPLFLRRMALADLTAVYQIYRLSFPTPARKGTYEYEIQKNDLAHNQVLGTGDALIGFSGYWLLADKVHISTTAVQPEWRGKNLGELLLLNMLFLACDRPVNMVTLEVRQSNELAQNLYLKYRFEVVGEHRHYYRDTGEDALIMAMPALDASYYQFLENQRDRLYQRLQSEALRP